jgi:RNA polymerase sigma-70 factor (ECF subfamily)
MNDRDLELVGKIAHGDKRAFETLFRFYGERVFRYAHRLTSDQTKAEEVANDVMLEVWKNAAKFEQRSKVSTWILGIARHLALNSIRRKNVDTVDIDETAPQEDESPTVEAELDHTLLQQGLKTALGKLSVEHRDVIELTLFMGCSYQEIAEIVGCPTNTVKTRMFHARKQLQGHMTEMKLSPDTVEMMV